MRRQMVHQAHGSAAEQLAARFRLFQFRLESRRLLGGEGGAFAMAGWPMEGISNSLRRRKAGKTTCLSCIISTSSGELGMNKRHDGLHARPASLPALRRHGSNIRISGGFGRIVCNVVKT
ncbi:hypothetical protein [Agrobacterium sp. T29]|uniref:hypothetical protein n=1 Tax=Agrobacterium sp. T29 TaxID=2580515 RepID=UPI001FEF2E3D|nr:hypothetical protein [Agrobacterium sp. T29]